MSAEKIPCPYCKGALFINTGYTEKIQNGRLTLYPFAQPCYCELNHSIGKKFGMLYALPDATPEDSEAVHKKYNEKGKNKGNFIFYGDEPAFRYTVKSYFLKGFTHSSYELLEGVNIVDKYNRPDSDTGARLSIGLLDQYDLVVILFTSRSEPPTLKACVADVVKNRLRIERPTWIYAPDKTLDTTKEYSKDLTPFLETFLYVEIGSTTYAGFSNGDSEKVKNQKARELQDALGSLK